MQGQKFLVNMHTKQERTLFDEAPKYGSRLFWLPDPFRYRLDLTILDLTILDCGSVLVPFWFHFGSTLVPEQKPVMQAKRSANASQNQWFQTNIKREPPTLPKTNDSKAT